MAINFLNNGVFAGDVTIPEYIYHSGDINTYLGFSANDEFLVVAGGSNKFAADANAAYMYYQGSLKLQTTSTGISISGQATGTFSGDISTSGSGQTNTPFRLGADYNSYMVAAAGTTWGLFWAGNSGARYGTNGNGGPGNIWGNNGNPNEFVFVGGDSTRWTVYGGSGDTWQSGNIYVGGGEIILSSTGRIQGVDTVSANTDAANKLYVDNAISGVPQGTVTISGTPVDNQLAVWTSATSIEGEAELTYDGSTFTVGGSGNTTTYLDVIGTNTAGAPARAAAIRIYGYEGRGEGIFYYDSAYASSEWYSGIPYGGGDTWQIGHDTGGQAEYTANAILRFTTAGAATFVGDININSTIPRINFTDLQQDDWAIINDNGEFKFQCTSGSGVALLLDTSNNATFAGNVLIPSNLQHVNDDNNEISFTTDAQDFRTNNVSRLDISNSGVRFGGSNARVTTVLDQDNMSSNSATALATQQSIKQYVDTAFSNAGTVTGTGSSGRVAFWNGTSSIASNSTLSWDDSNAELGIGTSSATTSLTIARGHSNTRANLYYFDASNIRKAYIDMWASEPGVSYNGSGIGSNINGSPYYGRKVTEQGQTYIRFIDGQFEVYTGTNSSGTGSTAARRFYIEDNGLSTFSTTPEVGTRSAGDNTGRAASTAFVTTAIGNVNTGVQSVSDDGGSTINVSGSSTARVVAAITGAVSSSSANLATGAQIQTAINTAIGTIPSGLAFEGNWDASTGNPPSSSPSNGQFWIVTVAGSTNLSGITDWKVGDWAIYVEQGAGTDAWQKVDNTSTLSGDGVANQLTYWTSTSNVAGDTGLTYDASANKLTVAGNLSAAGYNIFGLGLSTGTWYGDLGSNGYTRETGLAMTGGSEFVVLSKNGQGSTLVDGAYLAYESANGFFGSYNSSYGNLTGIQATAANTLTVKQLDGGTANLAITSIANATTDTDKFLVSNSGVVQYRTGAQVLSDIGAQASGNYLPVANPAFTGTLTGPAITITGDATVAGATLSGDTYSDPDLLLSVLSVDTNTSLRNKIGNSTSMTMVSDSTAPAPGVFEVSGSYYPDPFGQYYTIDEGDTFTFEFWYKFQSGTATYNLLYAGSNFYNAAGSSLGNVNRYWGESALNINANSGSDWYHVTGTLGPDRGTSVGDIPATAVSMRLLFLFNYAANGSAVTRFCGLKVYKSGQTVTQLYRKTLGSEANTTRNRDLVVDANGDLYGSKINATDNVTFAAGLQVTSPGSAFYNRFRSGNDYVIGLQDSLGDDEWWLKAYTNGAFALHENNVGDKFTIAAGGNATFSDQLTISTISNAVSDTDKFLVSDSGVIKYRTGAQVLSDIGAASSGSLGNYLLLAGGTMSGTIVSTATTALEMDGAAAAQGVLMQADSSGTYPVFLRSLNPSSGGETSPWLYKEASTPWGIWHNNPVNSFDFTRSGNNLGIANNVGGQTNSVMIRLTASDGSGTFAGKVVTTEVESSGTLLLDAAADITIDAGGQDIILSDDGTIFGTLSNSSGFQIRSRVNNADMLFRGVDNGAEFNALTLDMSEGGNATFAGTVTAADLLTVNGDGHLFLGADGETPKIDMMYDDHASGAGWDTRIFTGKTDDLPNGQSFPTSTIAGGYGTQYQANSDGAFFGIIPYTAGHFRPVINWGDDVADSPFSFQFNGVDKATVSSTGVITSLGGSSTEWNTSYDNMITAFSATSGSTTVLTLTQQDGGTLTTSFVNPQGTVTGGPYLPLTGGTLTGGLTGTSASFTGLQVIGDSITRSKTRGLGTNYATSEGWVAGAAGSFSSRTGYFGGNFNNNGATAENKVVYDIGPFGSRELVWMTVPETVSNADGGWNKSLDGFNNSANNGFMSIVYVRRDAGSAAGNFYHGCSGSNTLNLAGVIDTNPYFSATGIGVLPTDVWCVAIGIIHATNDTTTTTSALGGIYRLDTGEKIQNATTYRQKTSNAAQEQRVYHYYSTSTTAQLDFANPGWYILDGSEPSLGEILGSNKGDFLPLAGGTMTGSIKNGDGVYSYWGTGDDLQIGHDGSNSFIIDKGVGDLLLYYSDDFVVSKFGTSEISIRANQDSSVELFFDNSKKLETTSTGVTVTGGVVAAGAMSSFETTLTNNDDWQNSPISILERGNVQGTQTADKYAPNLNFHWGALASNSLWMGSNGNLNYGSYSGSGIPSVDGTFAAGNLIASSAITGSTGAFTGQVTGPTPTTTTSFANKAYVDAHPGTGGTVTSVATGGGLDGGTITTTGTIEVEYDGVPTNIIQSGFDFTGDTVVPGDYMMISDPGQTTTNRRIGYVTVGDLPKAPQTTFTRDINASTWTMLCTVNGDRLASIVDLTITGTSNGVVLAASFEIIVNHYQDIHVRSMSGDYLNTSIRITSNNNEDFSIEAKAGGGSTTTVEVCVFPRANEAITPTTTDPGYTGEEYVHTAVEGWRFGGEDGNTTSARVSINGALAIGTTFPVKPLTVNGTIRAEDNNSGDYIDITNDGSVSGHSKIETSNGNLIIDPAGVLDVQANAVVQTSNGVGDLYIGNYATAKHFRFHTNNNQTYFDMNCGQINWREGSSTRYYFYPSTANMTINGTLTQNSDSRVKENVVEIDNCISKVQAMRGVYYNRTDFNTEVTKVGVIAQEVEAVLPELILEASDTGLKSVAYAELTAVLINAIKEQQEIIDDLKTRIIKLEK